MADKALKVLLAHKWTDGRDPTGWWMSEKLDGVRAYWTGSTFYSRQGNKFWAPDFFTADLPKTPLDGELWCGRGLFQKTLSIVKKTKNLDQHNDDWKYVTYLVFDAPAHKGRYEERLEYMKKTINAAKQTTYAQVVGTIKCKGKDHLNTQLKEVLKKGGEGLMLRQPGSTYAHGRSHTLLKVKTFHDEEAKVTGSEKGTGRLSSLMGKIHCILPNGVKFKVGTGFTDAQRGRPPKIGSIITFKFQELSNSGTPRFPVFLHERPDLTWDDVVNNAKTKTPFSQIPKMIPTLSTKQHSILFLTVPSRDAAGAKMVTDDDDASDDEDEKEAKNAATAPAAPGAPAATSPHAAGGPRPPCKYGATCFRTNPKHLADFTHPTTVPPKSPAMGATGATAAPATAAPAGDTESKSKNVPCKFGRKCYQKSAQHLAKYSHLTTAEEEEKQEVQEAAWAAAQEQEASAGEAKAEWGLEQAPGSDDDEDDNVDYVNIRMPKTEWTHLQSMLAHLKGLTGARTRVTVTDDAPAGTKRKRNGDDIGGGFDNGNGETKDELTVPAGSPIAGSGSPSLRAAAPPAPPPSPPALSAGHTTSVGVSPTSSRSLGGHDEQRKRLKAALSKTDP